MAAVEVVTPSQVLAAVEYAKKQDPKDKYGDGAFRINVGNIRVGKNDVRYIPFEVLKQRNNGKWEFVPLNLKFVNLTTKSQILPPGHAKRKYNGVQIQFRGKDGFSTKTVVKKDGKEEVRLVEEPYGKAKKAIYAAFKRKVTLALKKQEFFHSKTNIGSTIQDSKKSSDPKNPKPEKFPEGDEIIRVTIPFKGEDNKIALDEPPKCDIYDINKKRPLTDEEKKNGEIPFEKATVDGKPLVYQNIGVFVRSGSSTSGVDCMDSVTLSSQGITLPSKVTVLMVKPSQGYKPDAKAVFRGEFADMENSETAAPIDNPEGDEEGDGEDTEKVSGEAATDLTDGLDNDGGFDEENLDA